MLKLKDSGNKPGMTTQKELLHVSATDPAVPASVLVELQRSFFSLISQAESSKSERIAAKKVYDEKARQFEDARKNLFEVAEFLQKNQAPNQTDGCDWMSVAKARLEAVDKEAR